jgi:UDP-glucuronate decarboxylase
MKTLVTGGAGFLGNHLCRYLLNKDEKNEIICVDNFFTGKSMNIEDLKSYANFKVIPHDITDNQVRLDTKIIEKVDQIYNLACPASPVHYQFDPIETISASVTGVKNMIEFAKLHGATILQASTSEIYGDPLEHPQKESYHGNVNTLGPRSCYDEGKRVAETLLSDYNRRFGVSIRIARIFNTYGPNMDKEDGRVVSNFIVQALKNKPLTIYGDGKQTRSFCYVDDLIEGFYKLMNSEIINPINLGNPKEFTVSELAEKVIELTGSRSKIEYFDLPKDDPKKRQPDITLASSLLYWTPKVSLAKGLEKTIEYFKKVV